MDTDNFILKFDLHCQNLFIHNSNYEEAYGEGFQVTVETTCASELKTIYLPVGRKNRNYWWCEGKLREPKQEDCSTRIN